jgi:hypothetical protein
MKHTGITLSELEKLLPAVIFGAEGEGDGDDSDGSDENDNDDAGSDDNNSQEHDDANDPKVQGLKSALAAERARAEAAEKKLKAQAKAKADAELKEKSELERAQLETQAEKDRNAKLAAGLLRRDLDSAIAKAARDAKFIDPDDAIAGVDRSALTYSQDEEDPTQITIETSTIETAVKALARKKPHFIQSGTDDGEPTGGQFGRSGKGKKKKTTEESYMEKYPVLRG